MDPLHEHLLNKNRRHFLQKMGLGIGGLALGSLLDPMGLNQNQTAADLLQTGPMPLPHFAQVGGQQASLERYSSCGMGSPHGMQHRSLCMQHYKSMHVAL